MSDDETANLSDATRDEEAREASEAHRPDRDPTPEEEEAAERAGGTPPSVSEHAKEATERGANVKGEGQID